MANNVQVTAADFAAMGLQPQSARFMTPEQMEMQRRSLIGQSPIPLQVMHEQGDGGTWAELMAQLVQRR